MIKFRLYFDKDAETEWLNQMAADGWAMKSFFAGFYGFENSCAIMITDIVPHGVKYTIQIIAIILMLVGLFQTCANRE